MQKKLFFISFLLLQSIFTIAQVRGTLETVDKQLPFNHNFNNVNLDPSPVVGSASRVQFVQTFSNNQSPVLGLNTVLSLVGADNISIPSWLSDLGSGVSFFCSGVEPTFNVTGSIDAGAYYEVNSVGNSDIEVNYPVRVVIDYPAANTFACGETIRINTNYTVLQPQDTKLKVTPPFVNQEIGPIIDNLTFSASIGLHAWVGYGVTFYYPCIEDGLPSICSYEACGDVADFNQGISFSTGTSLPQLPPLLNFCEAAFGPNANNTSLLNCSNSFATPFLTLGQQVLDVYNSANGSSYTFAEFPDEHTVVIAPPDIANGPTIPEMEGTFKDVSNTELNYSLLNNGTKLKVNGTKSSISQMSLDLVSLLDYSGYPTSYTLGDGAGSIDVGDVAPTLTIDQRYDFEYDPIVNLQINIGTSMSYSVFNANGVLDHTGVGQIVQLVAGQFIEAVLPQGQTSPLNGSGNSNLNGNFKSLSSQEYFRSLRLSFGEVKLAGVIDFTLFETEVLKGKFGEKGIIDHTFNLALPTGISLPNFILDPENPIVDVSYLNVEDVRNLGGGKRKVVYKVGLTNNGDVNLHNVQSTIDLAAAFTASTGLQVVCITSSDFVVNNGFNGSSNKNLLASENTLAVGQTKYLEFVIEVTPAISAVLANGCFGTVDYTIAAKVSATSPIGTNIVSDYNQCTMQVTGIDITTKVDLGASRPTTLQDFTIYGWKGVSFDKSFATSYGNVGSYSDLVFENVTANNGAPSTIVGDIHVKERIRLIGQSKAVVDYVQNANTPVINNNQCSLITTGTKSVNSSCVTVIPQLNLTKPTNISNVAVNVASSTTRVLTPGSYGTVTVSGNAILVLTPGVYNIDTWKFMGDNARVKYQSNNQAITIHVDKFQPLQRANLNMAIDGAGKVSDVRIYSYGNQPSKFSNSFVQGVIVAPNSEVEFEGTSKFEGACYADKVNFRNGAVFKGTSYTLPLNVSADCQQNRPSQNNVATKITSGLNDTEQSIVAYPNPVSNVLTIAGLDASVASTLRLIDLQGRQLRQFQTEGTTFEIDMQGLNTGVYLLVVDNHKQTFKIIKK